MHRSLVPVGTLLLVVTASCATAQSPAPMSDYTRSQLGQIKAQAIGRGYSVDDVNRMSLNQSRVGVIDPGTGRSITSEAYSKPNPPQLTRSAASFDSFGSTGSTSKPFSSASRGPTVSPYLNLFRDDFTDGYDNYNTLVRPQLQQQQVNQSLQLETQAIDRRVRAIAAKPAFDPRGAQNVYPTGHPTGFMYYSHFFPGMQPQQRRGR